MIIRKIYISDNYQLLLGAKNRNKQINGIIKQINTKNLFKFFKINICDDIKSVIYQFVKI